MDDDTRPNTYDPHDPYTPGAAYGPAVTGGPDDRLGWRGRAATWWVRRRPSGRSSPRRSGACWSAGSSPA